MRERPCLVGNQAHLLADSESVELSELSDEPFILFHNYEKNGEHNPHNGIFIRENFTPRESMRVSRGVDAVRLVQRNFGIADPDRGLL